MGKERVRGRRETDRQTDRESTERGRQTDLQR